MIKFCRFCNKNHQLPNPKKSNDEMVWENKSDRKSGGMHYCRINRTQKKRQAWDKFYGSKQLRCVVSRAITQKLKRKGSSKSGSILDALDYSIDQLKKHLESRFKPGMTWSNYGEWHIDHIIPDSAFQYKTMSDIEFKKAWALDNLQPLWATDNHRKYNKLVG